MIISEFTEHFVPVTKLNDIIFIFRRGCFFNESRIDFSSWQGLEDQTADAVVLNLIQPRPALYGLRVTYNTGTKVCEVSVPVSALTITGQLPAVEILKADSSCK